MKRFAAAFLLFSLLALSGLGQAEETADRQVGVVEPKGRSPEAAIAQPSEFTETVQKHLAAIFVVGAQSGRGTAWVVSKKHRLLVTNAHVADMFLLFQGEMFAVPSSSKERYRVEKVWYHPGVRRFLKGSDLSARESDPKKGVVDPKCPDLAVIQLASAGPDLEVEFAVAQPEELKELYAEPVAMCGFPGHMGSEFPGENQTLAASFHDGTISRITDFLNNAGAAPERLQCLQYTMASRNGFSGSPVFTLEGRVVAVHNRSRKAENDHKTKDMAHGVRIDCLYELLVHHGLEDKVPFSIDKKKVLVDRWLSVDSRTEAAYARFAQAVELVKEAVILTHYKRDHQQAEQLCSQAIQLAPNYAFAYSAKSGAIRNFRFDNQSKLSKATIIKLDQAALKDAKAAFTLCPTEFWYAVETLSLAVEIAGICKDREALCTFVKGATILIDERTVPDRPKAFAYYARGQSHYFLDENDEAVRDLSAAIQLVPDPVYYRYRAKIFDTLRRFRDAERDRQTAKAVEEEGKVNPADFSGLSG